LFPSSIEGGSVTQEEVVKILTHLKDRMKKDPFYKTALFGGARSGESALYISLKGKETPDEQSKMDREGDEESFTVIRVDPKERSTVES